MSGTTKLIKLCNLDLSIRRIENEIDSADDGKQLFIKLNSMIGDRKKFETAICKLKKLVEKNKEKINSGLVEKKKMESRLFGDKVNQKQIENIQTHLKNISEFIDESETKHLELLDKLDKYDAYMEKLKNNCDQLESDYKVIVARYKEMNKKARVKLDKLNRERESHIANMDGSDVELYETIRRRKAGIAMAEVVNKLCTACNQTISSSLDQSLSEEPDRVHYCNNCGRIVYRIKVET